MNGGTHRPGLTLWIGLALVLAGSLLAWRVQTDGGSVAVREVAWVAPSGARMSGLLYVPETATTENPAPGIVAIHGYINSRETQSGFAIEFARRGYVVLAIDQTGHGYSDPPAFRDGFGGPAALAYIRTLAFVDTANIGLEGHSMGGWASGIAAAAMPDAYRSIVLAGSSTGSSGVPQGTPEWPRNIAIVWSMWDEFSQTMWGTPVSAEIGRTEKLQALFGSEGPVEPGKIYGSVADGTARVLYQPRTNHPGDHLSREAIGNAVEWFSATLDGGRPIPPENQTWYWKEAGTLVALIGMVVLLFGLGGRLLETSLFESLRREPNLQLEDAGAKLWVMRLLTLALGPLTLFYLKDLPGEIGWSVGPIFPQSITNSVVAWTTVLGLITILLIAGGTLLDRRTDRRTLDALGLSVGGRVRAAQVGRSFLLAALIAAGAYLSLLLVDYLFLVDFRFWVFAVKPMSSLQLRMALVYFVPFAFYFLVLAAALFSLRRGDPTLGRESLATVAILTLGWVGLYLWQYVPLFTRGTMAIADEPLWTIISYQLLPIMTIVALVLTYFGRRTGTIYTGGFLSAMLVAWIVVASQATQFAF